MIPNREENLGRRTYRHGTVSLDAAFSAAKRVGHSKLELAQSVDDKIAIRKELLELAKQVEDHARARREAVIAPASDYLKARYFRLDAEIELVRAQRELTTKTEK